MLKVLSSNYLTMLFNFIDSCVQKREEKLKRQNELETQKIEKVIIRDGKRTLLRNVAFG